ncbi:hypothetical protein GSY74_00525 [Sulfurovum sp. bin170]|uniref:CU044_2847 family protein n=1 Tax=Sulfurovum sp. bin170 TaxID=2695268 RepID=UPI0013E00991|nr:CU044_2847 family protein [Sulfurovum sp. bin170]NEW59755.1 hypothetical protein [Sulfurovum sp. bin170]
MSKKLIELDNGLLMEVEVPQSEIEMISGGNGVIEKVDGSIDTIKNLLIKSIRPIAETYKELNKDMIVERAEVEIGISFSAEGNIFIASGKGSANLKVKLVLSPKGE